jgi:hypothetical protein
MATDVMGGSFLATLELKDGDFFPVLGFSRTVEGEGARLETEPHEYLHASTLTDKSLDKSLVVEFRYVRPGVYALSCWGLLDSAFNPRDGAPVPLAGHFGGPPLVIHSKAGSVPEKGEFFITEATPEEVADIGLNLDSGPKLLNPWFEKSSEALWIGVDAKGCIVKTNNKESALEVCIDNEPPQFVKLWSSTTKNYLKMIPPERLEGKQWCARMSDRDGVDALFKLRVIGVYGPDGEIQFT